MASFDVGALPDQRGRTAIVTGGNSGIGLEAARMLAQKGARIVLGCRNAEKAKAAVDAIGNQALGAEVEVIPLDLASLASVREFARVYASRHARLDLLVNNAGVMAIPRRETADGFEMQLGTNHLGHFALTGLLLGLLLETPGARVVNVSSSAHRAGKLRFDDLQSQKSYARWGAYGQSKLANLLFTLELQRRLGQQKRTQLSVACHPGWAATDLQFVAARMDGSKLFTLASSIGNRLLAQSAADGALPTVQAALAPEVQGGDYWGPDGFGELWGAPKKVGCSTRARSDADARRLFAVSELLTGVRFEALPA
jgi:NAD(P)-dependent dehydrogenase (short-subunit alcohol dehydrogenase family)